MTSETHRDLELRLREASLHGHLVDLSTTKQVVDATLLVELLTTPQPNGARRGVRVRGAAIVGILDLEAAVLLCPLRLEGCEFAAPISLLEAQAPAVRFLSCELVSLEAAQLRTRGTFSLAGSRIQGEVSLPGARIGGELDFEGATLTNNSGQAINAWGLRVDQHMLFRGGFVATGEIALPGAHIGGVLDFEGATLTNNSGAAISAWGLRVDQHMLFRGGFVATGEIALPGAHIGGVLHFEGATLTNNSGRALHADGLQVDQHVVCEGLTATGEVRLAGAHIGGQLDFEGATLTNDTGRALTADGLQVDQDVFCRNGFTATGEIRLPGAHVGGQLDLEGATLTNNSGLALKADGLQVDQDVFCRSGFAATGEIRLRGACIGGWLDFAEGRFVAPMPDVDDQRTTLDLENADLRALKMRFAEVPTGVVVLTSARVERIVDRVYNRGCVTPRCRLRGCQYKTLEIEPGPSVDERLAWLAADPDGYSPQPYEQLASVYRSAGDDEGAQRVLIAKQRRRRSEALGWPAKGWSLFLGMTVGYGYRLWLAGIWLLALALAGALLFQWVLDAAPMGESDLTPAKATDQMPDFQPAIYSIDVLLPVVSLGQDTAWNAHGAAQWVTVVGTLCGWLLTTALIAGLVTRRT
jgi:adhesin HecA-like repeat protein